MVEKQQNQIRPIILWVIGIGILAFIILILSIIFNVIPTDSISPSTTISDSEITLIESSTTLSPVGRGISSSEVNANNLTWLEFDGSNSDQIEIPNSQDFNFTNTGFTVEVYAKTKKNGTLDIISHKDRVGNNNESSWWLYTSASDEIRMSYSPTGNGTSIVLDADVRMDDNEYHQIVYGIDSIEGHSMIDGVYSKSIATGGYYYPDYPIEVARWKAGGNFNGSIDSISIYDTIMYNGEISYRYDKYVWEFTNQHIPVLLYHFFGNSSNHSATVNETQLREQMQFMKDLGFVSITDVEYYNWTQDNGFVMPERAFMNFWDDAAASVWNASVIMAEYGYKGILPVITGLTGTNDSKYLSWQNISDMATIYNWSIVAHTVTGCYLTEHGGINNCSSTDAMRSNMSQSKQDIIDNTGITPITFVHTANSWDLNSMSNCSLYFTICTASATSPDNAFHVNKETKGIATELGVVDNFWRTTILNLTTMEVFAKGMNFSDEQNKVLYLNFNENNGTIAHDSSGNSNDGTISGTEWMTDGALKTLAAIVDYTINPTTGLFTIVNNDYSWSQLFIDWSYTSAESRNDLDNIKGNYSRLLVNEAAQLPTVGTVIGIALLLMILIALLVFAIRRMMGVANTTTGTSNSKFNGGSRDFG